VEVLAVDRGPHGHAGDVAVDLLDLDVERAVGGVRLSFAAAGELEHPLLRRDAELVTRATFDEVRMERSLHPRLVAVEPALEVIERGRDHRRGVAARRRRLHRVRHCLLSLASSRASSARPAIAISVAVAAPAGASCRTLSSTGSPMT
jgi:hypothetical protein